MATYSLTVEVDQKWVGRFNGNNTKLCFASSVTSGKENFNVVASAKVVANTVTFSWTDIYGIAASHSSFENGVSITASTKVQEIQFQQSYTLPPDWTNRIPQTDPAAPLFGFQFINEAVDATAVVYKQIDGKLTPIYASAAGPLPPGVEQLTPKPRVKVWFANDMETATMIDRFMTTAMTIDFTGMTQASVSYDANGIWAQVPGSFDFSHKRLEKELELLEKAHEILGHRRHHKHAAIEAA